MTPRPARYLLRVDDLCPTVKREPWLRLVALIQELGIRPILAVVPDNRDADLRVSMFDETFWEKMCAIQRAGAAIALHGYQHRAQSRGRSLVPLHRKSEFAGVPASIQRTWIRTGLEILRLHGLNPKLWTAPRHGFDINTLEALSAEGISVLSDGFARRPFLRGGFTWIPQQIWGPVQKRTGLWTICLHVNTMTTRQFNEFETFVRERAGQFTSVDEALEEFPPSRLTVFEQFRENTAYARLVGSRLRCEIYRRLRLPPPSWVRPQSGSSQPATPGKDLLADRARPPG
jgi:hypothetical protein